MKLELIAFTQRGNALAEQLAKLCPTTDTRPPIPGMG